jgi:hypothetical protein
VASEAAPLLHTRKGVFVARKRPIPSNAESTGLLSLDGERPNRDGPLLTRAEARALRRSAPVTHARLEELLRAVRLAR